MEKIERGRRDGLLFLWREGDRNYLWQKSPSQSVLFPLRRWEGKKETEEIEGDGGREASERGDGKQVT